MDTRGSAAQINTSCRTLPVISPPHPPASGGVPRTIGESSPQGALQTEIRDPGLRPSRNLILGDGGGGGIPFFSRGEPPLIRWIRTIEKKVLIHGRLVPACAKLVRSLCASYVLRLHGRRWGKAEPWLSSVKEIREEHVRKREECQWRRLGHVVRYINPSKVMETEPWLLHYPHLLLEKIMPA